ncbi:hypothetical protein D0Z07_6572 [Hyphodiscus hymeniophilus]|uniref:DUF6590 domain-containing protein n=1 Tax=Hyphodiscus hymeniophilus TaxID=353542 RepID=A0A9P6VH95_9HELO|nr:hypothetical protein D0Z07_6572 [Hyphodiscus hymeniophilus]
MTDAAKVFKVLWSEPTGSIGTEITKDLRKAKFGETAYHSIRRFVIMSQHSGHCICLPILTYGGQATLKKGVHADDHAVIFTSERPVEEKGERLGKKAIKMIPDSKRHHLDSASRINYAKTYTVEHNVKVLFIGRIARQYEQQITTDYNRTHGPLPDRPYKGYRTDDDFRNAEGADPQYSSDATQAPPARSWPEDYGGNPASSAWSTSPNLQSSIAYAPQIQLNPASSTGYYPEDGGEYSGGVDPRYDTSR